MFVDVFIRRPILSSVLALVIILAGAIAIPTLPISQYPELAPPQVTVSSFYTGATRKRSRRPSPSRSSRPSTASKACST